MKLFLQKNNALFLLTLIGLALRVIYTHFLADYVASYYFHAPSIFSEYGEFKDWLVSIQQLVEKGTYTLNSENPYGYFARMPGYAFFIGFFYYLFQAPYYLYAIGYAQVLLDSCNIILLYFIYRRLYPLSRYPYLITALYAFNPIAIFWAPAMYSETLSVFLLVWGIYIYTCTDWKYKDLIAGSILGFDILVRPQIAIFVALFVVCHIVKLLRTQDKSVLITLFLFLLGTSMTYGLWPLRNYIFHDKIILTHDIRGSKNWGPDVLAYIEYNYSIQTQWEPQFSQIIKNQPFVVDPRVAYAAPTDSMDLAKAIFLSKHYGSGFSAWPGYWQNKNIDANVQDTVIVSLFNKLCQHQREYNAYHYWFILPLKTLTKSLFKTSLELSSTSLLADLGQSAFLWRTFLILIGIAGSCFWLRYLSHPVCYLIPLFFCSWYIIISFGSPTYFRNIEMRYLLQTDTLMLLPAAFFTEWLVFKLKQRLA